MSKTIPALAILALCSTTLAQRTDVPIIGGPVDYRYVGRQAGAAAARSGIVDEHVVRLPGRAWLALELENVELAEGSRLEIESLLDGHRQVFRHGEAVRDSAYFNGDALRVRLWAGARTTGNTYTIRRALASAKQPVGPLSLCGVDNRSASTDKRVARILVKYKRSSRIGVCSAFLISEWNCFATAGHCLKDVESLRAQFLVPPSLATGVIQHPPAQHQYAGPVAFAFQAGGQGDDWGVFTTRKNQRTGLYPGKAQGGYFPLSNLRPVQTLLVTGYGADTTPLTRNHVLQWAPGPLSGLVGTTLRYAVDTLGGSSGSPVHGTSSRVYAIHTHGGCDTVGYNAGTRVTHPGFLAARTRICVAPKEPDLSAVAFNDNSNGVFKAGQSYTFSSQIKNVGNVASPRNASGYYLSENSAVSTADRLLKSFETIALAPNATHAHAASVAMPTDLKNASCWPGVVADRLGGVAELSETNNARAGRPRKCENDLPDLLFDLLQVDKPVVWPGLSVKLTTRIGNKGNATAPAAQNGHYLSANSTISTTDTLLGNFNSRGLQKDIAQLIVKNVVMPSRMPVGKCWIGAYADNAFSVTEVSETNNTISREVKCGKRPLPDFIARDLKADSMTWQAGTLRRYELVLQNIGATGAAASRMSLLMSKDSRITLTDVVLSVVELPALGANKSIGVRVGVWLPKTLTSGTCWVGAYADSGKAVEEEREDNNTTSLKGLCLGKPDLVISKLVRAPAVVNAGSLVQATIETKNIGSAATGGQTVTGAYLSTDATITTTDTFLGSYGVPDLAVDATASSTQSYRIPYCASGNLFFGALADAKLALGELSEANNDTSASLIVNRYQGTARRIEWRDPRLDNEAGPFTTTDARWQANKPVVAKMCLAAPNDAGKVYVCVWSQQAAPFAFDLWSNISLALANTAFFPNWVGVMPATGFASAGISIPPGLPPLTLYTHVGYFGGGFAWGDNALRMKIDP